MSWREGKANLRSEDVEVRGKAVELPVWIWWVEEEEGYKEGEFVREKERDKKVDEKLIFEN